MGDVDIEKYWREVILPFVANQPSVDVYLVESLDWDDPGEKMLAWELCTKEFREDRVRRYREVALSLDYVCKEDSRSEHVGDDMLISDGVVKEVYYSHHQYGLLTHQVALRLSRLLDLGKRVRFVGLGLDQSVDEQYLELIINPQMSQELAIIRGVPPL